MINILADIDFEERVEVMEFDKQVKDPAKEAILAYKSGYVIFSVTYDTESERSESIELAKDYISSIGLTNDYVSIKDSGDMICVKRK